MASTITSSPLRRALNPSQRSRLDTLAALPPVCCGTSSTTSNDPGLRTRTMIGARSIKRAPDRLGRHPPSSGAKDTRPHSCVASSHRERAATEVRTIAASSPQAKHPAPSGTLTEDSPSTPLPSQPHPLFALSSSSGSHVWIRRTGGIVKRHDHRHRLRVEVPTKARVTKRGRHRERKVTTIRDARCDLAPLIDRQDIARRGHLIVITRHHPHHPHPRPRRQSRLPPRASVAPPRVRGSARSPWPVTVP